jgi:hypothetical protein
MKRGEKAVRCKHCYAAIILPVWDRNGLWDAPWSYGYNCPSVYATEGKNIRKFLHEPEMPLATYMRQELDREA